MTRRLIATLVAVLCTVLGAVLLVGYVTGADKRAMANLEATNVLVVVEPIVAGTHADSLGGSVEVTSLPRAAVVAGSVTSVTQLAGRVAAVDLQPGEQVLVSRFVDPPDPNEVQEFAVPAGLQAVSIVLDAQRVHGGVLSPGDKVGVFVSVTQPEEQTRLVLSQALVLKVQGGVSASSSATSNSDGGVLSGNGDAPSASSSAAEAPDVSVMVTLALSTADSEKLVFGAEHGSVWLSVQNERTTTTGSRIVTAENVYK